MVDASSNASFDPAGPLPATHVDTTLALSAEDQSMEQQPDSREKWGLSPSSQTGTPVKRRPGRPRKEVNLEHKTRISRVLWTMGGGWESVGLPAYYLPMLIATFLCSSMLYHHHVYQQPISHRSELLRQAMQSHRNRKVDRSSHT